MLLCYHSQASVPYVRLPRMVQRRRRSFSSRHCHPQAGTLPLSLLRLTCSALTALAPKFFVYNESPLFLQLSRATTASASASASASSNKDLPVAIYESNLEIIDNEPEVVFTQTAYEIETGEAERVAVDHASKPDMVGEGGQSSRESPRPVPVPFRSL